MFSWLAVGGNYLDTEGLFIWARGTDTNFPFWRPGEPNSYTINHDCIVLLYPGGNWDDFHCFYRRTYLCENDV